MPRISAPTVVEHRAMVQQQLVDAAEQILRSGQPDALTASAVTAAVGIARNSIYRYVDSVDDLRGLVLARHLPSWLEAVDNELAAIEDPADRVAIWVRANLEQAARSGHGWLMGLGQTSVPSEATMKVMETAHATMRDVLANAWMRLAKDRETAMVAAGFTRGILEAGFKQLDAGRDPELVARMGEESARCLVATVTAQR
ncbi:TetR/AcrR family transcriptional regulator [Tessaracoccus antarcticus]|uniref:TetR/AcrR family transcriptional regulator n=1 Tax=Tessaracoccus antarcticus TaxID=2479848 RepID=A0A3M0GK17_9ACTN|nr:TetR/AcrR family transcriptional regulator [Tessaracoccus antarcticus]RMB61489.1 TetR/AcrR family transcriptional regulator [Tessaracoccus antarcticus]